MHIHIQGSVMPYGPSHRISFAAHAGTRHSSIVPFPRNDSKWQSAKPSAKVLAQPRFLDLEVPKAPNDTRPIALFDLNGTLTSHTAKRRSAGVNKMRPGVHHLMRLHVSHCPPFSRACLQCCIKPWEASHNAPLLCLVVSAA